MGVEKRSFDVSTTEEESLDFFKEKIELNNLKENINTVTSEPEKVKKKLSGRVLLPYTRKGEKRNFLIENTGKDKSGNNTVEIRVKKLGTDGNRYTQDETRPNSHNNKKGKAITISYSNNQTFNIALGKVLDKYIGTDRAKIPKKSSAAYKLVNNVEVKKKSLRNKPIDLGYYAGEFEDKKITLSLPDRSTPAGRIMRALRRKPITDAAEDRYGIPRGLLMALMAQETYGDPTIPNGAGDGGLGVIHIQGKAADIYGNKVLPRYNNNRADKKHGDEIKKALEDNNYNVEKLIKADVDDRFHPIMAIDLAARYLVEEGKRAPKGKDKRLTAVRIYNKVNRPLNDYVYPTLGYRTVINNINGDKMLIFTKGGEDVKKSGKTMQRLKQTKLAIKNSNPIIDGETVTYKSGYLNHFKNACNAYGLDKYEALGNY